MPLLPDRSYNYAAEAKPVGLLRELDAVWRLQAIGAFHATFEAPQSA